MRKPPVPWWNNDCKVDQNGRTFAERALKRRFTLNNKIKYNRAKANGDILLTLPGNPPRKNQFTSLQMSGKFSLRPRRSYITFEIRIMLIKPSWTMAVRPTLPHAQ